MSLNKDQEDFVKFDRAASMAFALIAVVIIIVWIMVKLFSWIPL